jgi:hypothetical protein
MILLLFLIFECTID